MNDHFFVEFVEKNCDEKGHWDGQSSDKHTSVNGWTNYTSCFTPEMVLLMKKLYSGSDDQTGDDMAEVITS